MTSLPETLSTLLRLRAALPVQGDWKADHDCEWSEAEAVAYVHPAADGVGHNALFKCDEFCDFRDVEEAHDDERGPRFYDRGGQAITRYVAALHNALPELVKALEEKVSDG